MSLLGYYARNASLLYLWPIGRGHSGSRHPAVILPNTETYHLDHLARPLFLSQQAGWLRFYRRHGISLHHTARIIGAPYHAAQGNERLFSARERVRRGCVAGGRAAPILLLTKRRFGPVLRM